MSRGFYIRYRIKASPITKICICHVKLTTSIIANIIAKTVYIHCASVQPAAKLVAALLRVAGVTAGLAESNGSLPPGL